MTTVHTTSKMMALLALGQSVWLDYLRRDMIQSGDLASRVADGLRGMTSNPSIFESAIGGSKDYDEALAQPAMRGKSASRFSTSPRALASYKVSTSRTNALRSSASSLARGIRA